MTLDVWLVARLAAELHDSLSGARIVDVAADDAGFRVTLHRRRVSMSLRLTSGGRGALLALRAVAEGQNENAGAGWAGGVAPLLRGCTVESVQAVPGDRIVFVDVVSRSAFGVPARHRIAYELEPNKSNVLVLRPAGDERWQVLAAAKEVEGAEGSRSIDVGEAYEPPPPRRSRLDRAAFDTAVRDVGDPSANALARLLGDLDPMCSPPLAREVLESALEADGPQPLSQRLIHAWQTLGERVARASADIGAPVYAWGSGDSVDVVHLVELSWPPGPMRTIATLLEACAAQQSADDARRKAPALDALRKRLATMIDRSDNESASLRAAQRRADDADALRAAGDAIYTYLADIPARADEFVTPDGARIVLEPALTAKENAASYFRRFKKARSGLPRIAQRLAVLERNRSYWESLAWELDRAAAVGGSEAVAVSEEIAGAIGRGRGPEKRAQRARFEPRTVALAGGAIAHVGRSPKDNERVTFAVGAPTDLWFHARNVPGAHVILKPRDPRERPTDEQILAAAALAAGQSRAADAAKVEVDYTARKHVRKQGGGRIGLVWYTDFKTVLVAPNKI